jgi:hypothetical protein
MVHYLLTKGSFFTDTVYYLLTKDSLFADTVYFLQTKVHFLPTLYTIWRQKVHYLPTLYTLYTLYMTWCTMIVRCYFQTFPTNGMPVAYEIDERRTHLSVLWLVRDSASCEAVWFLR